jgi:succinyl-CoA synthetase beta subunit
MNHTHDVCAFTSVCAGVNIEDIAKQFPESIFKVSAARHSSCCVLDAHDRCVCVLQEAIHPLNGPTMAQLERLARGLCNLTALEPLSGACVRSLRVWYVVTRRAAVADDVRSELMRMWTMFDHTDASMLEINPLAELKDGRGAFARCLVVGGGDGGGGCVRY